MNGLSDCPDGQITTLCLKTLLVSSFVYVVRLELGLLNSSFVSTSDCSLTADAVYRTARSLTAYTV